MLGSIITTEAGIGTMALAEFMGCTAASLLLGVLSALMYMVRNEYRKDFVITLALLPIMVQMVIMMVNGNMGTGLAVMGAFSLVRFRSIPGTAKDIASIFCSMAIGLATGMGYIGAAAIFLACVSFLSILLNAVNFGSKGQKSRELRITIPESLEYEGMFDDIFSKHLKSYDLKLVKTKEMGSLFELVYTINLKNSSSTKDLIDELRCRNGNMRISIGMASSRGESI